MKIPLRITLAATAALLVSCDKETVVEVDRQPPPDLIPRAQQMAQETFATLSARLSEVIAADGVIAAIEVCSVEALPLTEAVSAQHVATVRRVSHRPRNPLNSADTADLETIARFKASLAAGDALLPEVTGGGGMAVVRLPIVLSQPLCLSCHGTPGVELDAATHTAIRDRYPDDAATGFSLGELRGIWRVEIPEVAAE